MDSSNRVPWVNIAVGILAIISPFVAVPTSSGAKWDLVITGAVICVVAIVEMASYGKSQSMNYWPAVNILAGIWLFISTSFLSGNVAMIWSNIVLGVVAIVAALVALSNERTHASHQISPPTHTHQRT